MNSKTDSSSSEEVQSSGISSMSDDAPSIENGTSYQAYDTPGSFELYADDPYGVMSAYDQKPSLTYRLAQDASDIRRHETHRHGNAGSHGATQIDLKPTFAEQNSSQLPGFDQSLLGIVHGNSQLYSPFGDANRGYFLDSDLETIEEESSVIDSDLEDRSSIRSDKKRLQTEYLQSRKHSRNGSASSMMSSSLRSSVASMSVASDDERSSSTLSSMSSKRSSVSSRSDRSTPNNEQKDEWRTDSEPTTPRHHRHEGKTNGYEIGAIDPNAQQKIVYAKCLSPQEQAKRSHKSAEKTRQDHLVTNSHRKNVEDVINTRQSKSKITISDMFAAVRYGDVKTLSKFSATEQSETVDERGNTILHTAAISGHLPCVQLLATGFCSQAVSLLNDDLMTPAALSVQYGHLCCVQWLVQKTAAKEELIVSSRQASIDGSNMRPPLAHVAARYNQDVVLDWLCEEMSSENFPVDSADHHSSTAVHEAATHGHLKSLQTLVGRGASVTVLNSHGDTPGQVADKNGHNLCVGYLVVVETCMSLAQQLITIKLENEGVKKENNNLRMQLQSMHNSRLAQAKESVEERIKATLQNLCPYEEDNEDNHIQAQMKRDKESEKMQTQSSPQMSVQNTHKNHKSLSGTTSDSRSLPSNSSSAPINGTPIQTRILKENGVPTLETVSLQNSANNSFDTKENSEIKSTKSESDKKTTKQHNIGSTDKIKEGKYLKTPEVHNGGYNADEDLSENAEIQTLTNGLTQQKPKLINAKIGQGQTTPGQQFNVKTWEKMAMDDVIRMARDSRYLPSPTISMCTEDSTMESREMMRDRLAEASRWFMVQQSGGKPRIKDPLFPTTRLRPPNSERASPKSPHKSMGNTASWVHEVQNQRKDKFAMRTGQSKSQKLIVPQNFVNATNQLYEKLQVEQNSIANQKGKETTPPSNTSFSVNNLPISQGSPISSISNFSSCYSTEREKSNPQRPNSAKSSCSTTSTVRSNLYNSSSSSISNSTATSNDTVVENQQDNLNWRTNGDHDPLQKRQTHSSYGSPASVRSHRSSRPTSAKNYNNSKNSTPKIYQQDPLSSNETPEVRVALPQRNNSFLRKIQPSTNVDSTTQINTKTDESQRIPAPVLYPTVITKPTSNQKLSTKLMSLANSQSFPTQPTTPKTIQRSEVPMQTVEIVSPSWSDVSARSSGSNHRETTISGKGYVMWKPSAAVTKHVDPPVKSAAPSSNAQVTSTQLKDKKTKQTSKQPYGGLFSSNSPKSSGKRKNTKLFHF